MPHRPSRRPARLRRAMLSVAAAACGVVTALAITTPAYALPSGVGWSASWDYYTTTSFEYQATLPGVKLTGYGTDSGGSRTTLGTIEDTAADGRCARVLLYANGVGYIADKTTCGSGTYQTYYTGTFYDSLLIIVYRMVSGSTSYDKSLYTFVPSSAADPTLRTVGTGTSWSYYTSTAFQYTATRPGVRVSGYGSHQAADLRSALSVVESTTGYGCADGKARDYNTTVTASACFGGSATFSAFDFDGWIEADACFRGLVIIGSPPPPARCVTVHIPEPY